MKHYLSNIINTIKQRAPSPENDFLAETAGEIIKSLEAEGDNVALDISR